MPACQATSSGHLHNVRTSCWGQGTSCIIRFGLLTTARHLATVCEHRHCGTGPGIPEMPPRGPTCWCSGILSAPCQQSMVAWIKPRAPAVTSFPGQHAGSPHPGATVPQDLLLGLVPRPPAPGRRVLLFPPLVGQPTFCTACLQGTQRPFWPAAYKILM